MEKVVSLCKRRGFIFPSSEIYGGLNGAWDYGPLGVELKRNLKQAWWEDMLLNHDETAAPNGAPGAYGMVGLDCALLMNSKVWEASGHVGGFSDPMVDDRETRARYRADQLAVFHLEFVASDGSVERIDDVLFASPGEIGKTELAELLEPHKKRVASLQKARAGKALRIAEVPNALREEALRAKTLAPGASAAGTLTAPRAFNLMFKTYVGAARGQLERDVPAARDGAGHLRELPQRLRHGARAACRSGSPRSARRSATRSIRATSPSAAASSSRWRSSSSAIPPKR